MGVGGGFRPSPGGGAGAVLGGTIDAAVSNETVVNAADAGPYAFVFPAPPAWLAANGTILAPGLYHASVLLRVRAGAFIAGDWLFLSDPLLAGQFGGALLYPADQIDSSPSSGVSVPGDIALLADDLPWPISGQVRPITVQNPELGYTLWIQRMAH